MMLVKTVTEMLRNGGMLNGWSDDSGTPHPAPIIQNSIFREEDIGDERCVFVRIGSGYGGTRYNPRVPVDIYLFGLKDKSDAYNIEYRSNEIYTYLLTSPCLGVIMGATQVSVSAPNISSDGRPYCIISFVALTDRGITK